jgi:broad specificity phosphatase PhoE
MAVVYLVQHGEKQGLPGDPGLTAKGRQQATAAGRWLHGLGVHTLGSSPLRRAREQPHASPRSPGSPPSSMPGWPNA